MTFKQGALEVANGIVQTVDGLPLAETNCVVCGQCLGLPVGAIVENEEMDKFLPRSPIRTRS